MSDKLQSQNAASNRKSVKPKPTKRKRPSNGAVPASSASSETTTAAGSFESAAVPHTVASSSIGSTRSSASAAKRMTPSNRKPTKKHGWPFVALIVVIVIIVAGAGLFSWDRWFRYDDASDMQGEWKVADKQYVIVLNGQSMKLANDVTYGYTLDPFQKTITYTFASSSGHGSYRFSADRQTLVIEDNGSTDWLVALHLKKDPVLDEGQTKQGTSVLTKVSSNTAASPQSLVNQTTAAADAVGLALDSGASVGDVAKSDAESAASGVVRAASKAASRVAVGSVKGFL